MDHYLRDNRKLKILISPHLKAVLKVVLIISTIILVINRINKSMVHHHLIQIKIIQI